MTKIFSLTNIAIAMSVIAFYFGYWFLVQILVNT